MVVEFQAGALLVLESKREKVAIFYATRLDFCLRTVRAEPIPAAFPEPIPAALEPGAVRLEKSLDA